MAFCLTSCSPSLAGRSRKKHDNINHTKVLGPPTPEGEAKTSAVILQLAEPLMKQHGTTAERAEALLMLTIAGWNKSMFPPDKQPLVEKDLINAFVPKDGSAEAVGVAVEVMDRQIKSALVSAERAN